MFLTSFANGILSYGGMYGFGLVGLQEKYFLDSPMVLLFFPLIFPLGGCDSPRSDTFPGYAEADFTYMASPLGGRLRKLAVQRGQTVEAGALLFHLDDETEIRAHEEARARLRQAESQWENLKKGLRPAELAEIQAGLDEAREQLAFSRLAYHRDRALFQDQILARESLDRAEVRVEVDQARVATVEAALQSAKLAARPDDIRAMTWEVAARRAALSSAQWQISQQTVHAGRHAQVYDTFFTEGEYVPPGRPVVALLVPDRIHIRFFIPEPNLGRLRMGAAVRLSCDGCPPALNGKVSYISPKAEYTPPVLFSRELRADLVLLVEVTPETDTRALIYPGQPFEVRLMDGTAAHE